MVPGILESPVVGSEAKSYTVSYSGGWVTPEQARNSEGALVRNLPFDIERAVIDMVTSLYLQRGRDRSVTARTAAQGSSTFATDPAGYADTAKRWRHYV